MKKKSFVIEPVSPKDARALLAMFREILVTSRWVLSEPDEIAGTVRDEKRFIERHCVNANALLIAAKAKGEIIGILNATNNPKRRVSHVVHVGVSVLEKWRGQGVGTALMKHLMAWAHRHRGIRKVRLSVIVDNLPALRLYRKLGFVTEGRSRKAIRIGRRYHDTIEMAKFV